MVDLNTGKPWEKVQFMAIGRDTSAFECILNDAYALASIQEEGKTIIYTNWGTEWRPFGEPRRRRSFESVILDEGLADYILNDVNEFRTSSAWYTNRGIPYRRGYLLHGPPGSGKTSFIMALAGKLGYNVCILNLAERGLTDERLAQAMSVIPPLSIVLLEDVDAAFPHRNNNNSHMSDVTFSGLLNVLDGASSTEDRIVFMTTNHIDRLDAALIRPGRIDVVRCVDNATEYQIRVLFKKFYPDAPASLVDSFVNRAGKDMVRSMASLQGHFLQYKDSPQLAIERIDEGRGGGRGGKEEESVAASNIPEPTVIPARRRPGRLTADEIERMPFNPQGDWEKDLYNNGGR